MLDHELRILGLDVHSGPDGAATDSQIAQIVRGFDYALEATAQRPAVRVELLSKPDRHRVLEVGAAGFQHLVELLPLLPELLCESFERLLQTAELAQTGETDRGGNHVVRRLRHVDVIVRMNRRVRAALAAEDLVGAVRQHFVDVHVVRRARARLIDVDDEVLAVLAGENLVCGLHDRVRDLRVEPSRFPVRQRRRALDPHCRVDEGRQRPQSADWKVLHGAQSLHAVKRVGGNFERAQRILLGASVVAHGRCL